MKKKPKKPCHICRKEFEVADLYPTALIRNEVLNLAIERYPNLNDASLVCFPDLRKISTLHFETLLKKEKGTLSELEEEVLLSLRQHQILSENINKEFEQDLTFGERLADKVSKFGGSWTFITFFAVILLSWIGINSLQIFNKPLDPFPYIFLNLLLSCLAAIQAPIIMMSQNRQAAKDRLSQEHDYQINLKSELHIRHLNSRLDHFMKNHWQNMDEMMHLQQTISQTLEKLTK